MMRPATSPINARRVSHFLDQFGRIGYDAQTRATSRLAYSRQDIAARKLLVKKLGILGLHVYSDEVGNVIGLTESLDNPRPLILIGSHLDTVQNGGKYDGSLGIVAALELLHQRQEGRIAAQTPLGIACFACEEAARFGKATIGSRYFTGDLSKRDLNDILESRSDGGRGRSLAQILREKRPAGILDQRAVRDLRHRIHTGSPISLRNLNVAAFLELHIEQGPNLEMRGVPVGVVTAIAAPTRIQVCLEHHTGHSGTTPMQRRTDLFLLAMRAWKEFYDFCESQNDEELVWTLIGMNTPSQQWGTIPGRLRIDVEIRSTRATRKKRCAQYLERTLRKEASRLSARVSTFRTVYDASPTSMNGDLIRTVARAARRLGIEAMKLPSMAGHDAAIMAKRCKTAMIFVPCKDGVSHGPNEAIRIHDVTPGIRVLLESVRALSRNH